MSQEQPQREQQEALKYGDVFNVNGELAEQPIAPQDAAMMQSAEAMVFGQTQKGGPASVMQAAAAKNERSGVVSHEDATQVAGDEGVTVAETQVPGRRIVTESVAGQILGQYVEPLPVTAGAEGDVVEAPIAIGEALAATALVAGEKPVEQSDAAAIRVAEARATGSSVVTPGGLAATAQSAASVNERLTQDVDKITLNDVLTVVGQYIQPTGAGIQSSRGTAGGGQQQGVTSGSGGGQQQQGGGGGGGGAITIGQALEAAAQTIPGKPVDQCDAAAIQAAEVRATGSNVIIPGGVAATAQSAAAYNESMIRDEDKVKLGDVLSSATKMLPADKPATRQDAEGVVGAELRNKPDMSTTPGGVAASVTVAARMNERSQQQQS